MQLARYPRWTIGVALSDRADYTKHRYDNKQYCHGFGRSA
jgi:hypothetical protein